MAEQQPHSQSDSEKETIHEHSGQNNEVDNITVKSESRDNGGNDDGTVEQLFSSAESAVFDLVDSTELINDIPARTSNHADITLEQTRDATETFLSRLANSKEAVKENQEGQTLSNYTCMRFGVRMDESNFTGSDAVVSTKVDACGVPGAGHFKNQESVLANETADAGDESFTTPPSPSLFGESTTRNMEVCTFQNATKVKESLDATTVDSEMSTVSREMSTVSQTNPPIFLAASRSIDGLNTNGETDQRVEAEYTQADISLSNHSTCSSDNEETDFSTSIGTREPILGPQNDRIEHNVSEIFYNIMHSENMKIHVKCESCHEKESAQLTSEKSVGKLQCGNKNCMNFSRRNRNKDTTENDSGESARPERQISSRNNLDQSVADELELVNNNNIECASGVITGRAFSDANPNMEEGSEGRLEDHGEGNKELHNQRRLFATNMERGRRCRNTDLPENVPVEEDMSNFKTLGRDTHVVTSVSRTDFSFKNTVFPSERTNDDQHADLPCSREQDLNLSISDGRGERNSDFMRDSQNRDRLSFTNMERKRRCDSTASIETESIQEDMSNNKALGQTTPVVTSMFGTDFPYQNMLHPVERDNDNKRTNQASNVNTSDRREGIRRSEDRSETRDNGEGEEDNDGDGGGGGGDKMHRRVFGILSLKFSIKSRAEFLPNNVGSNAQAAGLTLDHLDVQRFIRFFGIHRFAFLYKDVASNTFYFHTGNRNKLEVIDVLNQLKDRLKSLCFARFYGSCVNGEEITHPDDLVCSFALEVINDNMNSRPNTIMVV